MTQLEPMPSGGKPAVQSMTVWGALAGLAGLLLPPLLIRLHLTPADANDAATYVGQIIGAAGGLVAIWGRTRGSAPLPPITTVVKKET